MKKSALIQLIREELDIVTEGVYDPGSLKAVFLAGGPGSGKSYIAGYVFGVSNENGSTVSSTISSYGLKLFNSDIAFEYILRKKGIDMSTLAVMPDVQFQNIVNTDRVKAKKMTDEIYSHYKNGRLGMIIDSTSANMSSVVQTKNALEKLGYDCYMLFISTDLEVALHRNRTRSRVLPNALVSDLWHAAIKNKRELSTLFRENFHEIINNETGVPDTAVSKKIISCIKSPIQNPIGKEWIATELKLRNRLKQL